MVREEILMREKKKQREKVEEMRCRREEER